MKTRAPSWIFICASLAFAGSVAAQAPAPARPASAAAAKPAASAPRPQEAPLDLRPPRTTAETSRDAMNPDDARPYGAETTAVPQVRIPLGKKPTQPEGAPVQSGVNDSAARCEAMRGEQQRVKCREQVRLEARDKAPAR